MTFKDSAWWNNREAAFISLFTMVGAILRLWQLPRLGLLHFDEGIYALAGTWSLQRQGIADLDPGLIPYAPPGFVMLIGAGYALLGLSDLAAMAPSILLGTLTIPLAGVMGRHWFGPGAGACSAALAATCGPHIAFSRIALTDASFLLFWMLALHFGVRFLQRPGAWRAVSFGLLVGLAQIFKYNGILTGVVVAACVCVDAFVSSVRREQSTWPRAACWGLLAMPTAFLIDLPWILFVQSHGGYDKLLSHQRSYFKGATAWLVDWRLQMEQGARLSGQVWSGVGIVGIGCLLGGLAAWSCVRRESIDHSRTGPPPPARLLGLAILAIGMGLIPNLPWWIGVAFFLPMAASRTPADRLCAVWWLVCSLITPLYHPYARLWLPVHAVGWFMVARVIASSITREDGIKFLKGPPTLILYAALILAGASQSLIHERPGTLADLLRPSDSLKKATRGIEPSQTSMIRALTTPPVRYYLLLDGYVVQPIGDIGALRNPQPSGSVTLIDRRLFEESGGKWDADVPSGLARHLSLFAHSSAAMSLPTILDLETGQSVRASGGNSSTIELFLFRHK